MPDPHPGQEPGEGSGQPGSIPAEEWGPGYEQWRAVLRWLGQRGPEGTVSLVRVASHLVIVAVAVAVLVLSRVQLPEWQILQAQTMPASAEEPGQGAVVAMANPALAGGKLVRAAVPFTLIPERPKTDLVVHTVEAGDTLYDIADKYHITADTLVWANNLEDNPDLLRLGQQLIILPVNGVLHVVADGDTLDSIAKKYNAKASDILNFPWNQLDPENPALEIGKQLIVPNGTKPMPPPKPKPAAAPAPGLQIAGAPANAPKGSGRFIWPTSGAITQYYGRYHLALDIGQWIGEPIKAAESGYGAVAGWSNVGYGWHIIVDHGNGWSTLYAHLSKINVKAGQAVTKGDVIGLAGTSGNSTGPHLHFEIRYNGVGQNPLNYLP